MTQKIQDFLRARRDDGPCLVVDLDVVRDNYHTFERALPDSRVFYAVKANPDPAVLNLLAQLGSCFDTASVVEIEQVLATGATADRISFGNTIKKERDAGSAGFPGARGLRLRSSPLHGGCSRDAGRCGFRHDPLPRGELQLRRSGAG